MIPNKDNPKTPLIARVSRLFEDTKHKTGKKRVLVDWYLRADDCRKIKRVHGKGSAKYNEIFQYSGKSIPRNIDAESIKWRCYVYNFKYRGSVEKRTEQHFFCRKKFDERNGFVDLDPIPKLSLDMPTLKLDDWPQLKYPTISEFNSIRKELEAAKAALESEKSEKNQLAIEKGKIEADFKMFRKEVAKSKDERSPVETEDGKAAETNSLKRKNQDLSDELNRIKPKYMKLMESLLADKLQ